MIVFAEVNALALGVFSIVLAITLAITFWASRRATSTDNFYAAGRGITGFQNGLAISGDYLSAASFLGIAGLIYLYGFDGFVYSIGFLVAFLTVMFLLAERMRNAGKYTIADVLSFRLRERPARVAAAIGTLNVAAFYLIAQMVGAGVLIQTLVGFDFTISVLLTGTFMLCYVVFGGMIATTWVQIIKAVLLMIGIVVMSVFVFIKTSWNPIELFNKAEAAGQAKGSTFSLAPGRSSRTTSTCSRSGSPSCSARRACRHILMRFFTVPTAQAARSSVVTAMFIIGGFYLLTTVIGFGARALLGQDGVEAAGKGGNLARRTSPRFLGGGAGTTGGDLFPRDHRRHRLRDDPRGGRRASSSPRRARSRTTSTRACSARAGLRTRGGHRREDLGDRHRGRRHGHRDHRRRGAERLVHGRPGLRHRGERELPRAPARLDLAAVQHGGRGDGRPARGRLGAGADHHQPDRVGRGARRAEHRRVRLVRPQQPGDHLDPAGFPGLLPGHGALVGEGQRS
jgi:hypothetical protein